MFKKLIYISILFIFCVNAVGAVSSSTQDAYLEYNGYPYTFRRGDEEKFIKQANMDMLLWEKAQSNEDKDFYLHDALRYYFLVMQINNKLIEPRIGLGRVYDALKLDVYAQEHFFAALNLNNRNPKTNFYFANYYFNRDEYMMALFYYKRAYDDGYQKNYQLNYQMGVIYEKLADIISAKKYYLNALILMPKNSELIEKIRLLDELNYSESQYYLHGK